MQNMEEIFQELKNYVEKNTKVFGVMYSTITTNDIILYKDNMNLTLEFNYDTIKCHEWSDRNIEDDNIWWFKENDDPIDMQFVKEALYESIDSYIL